MGIGEIMNSNGCISRNQVIEMSDALLAVQRQRNQLITEIAEVEELICRAQAALERLHKKKGEV